MTEEKPAEAEFDIAAAMFATGFRYTMTELPPQDDEQKGTHEMSDVNPFELSELPVAQAPAPAPSPNNGRRKYAEADMDVPVSPALVKKRGGRPKGSKNKVVSGGVLQDDPPKKRPGRPPGRIASGLPRDPAIATATATQDVKISLATAMDALCYLKEEDRALTAKFVQVLSGINKGSRERILAAVGKVFA